MTTLENRPNTALLVVDVQNGVVEGAPERDSVVANVGSLVEKARQERGPRCLGAALRRRARERKRRVADRPRVDARTTPSRSSRRTTATPSRTPPSRPCSRASVSGDSSSSAHRPMRASARRSTARSPGGTTRPLSATPTRRRTRRLGRAAAGAGHRAHEPVLERPDGAGAHGRDGRDQGCRLRRLSGSRRVPI